MPDDPNRIPGRAADDDLRYADRPVPRPSGIPWRRRDDLRNSPELRLPQQDPVARARADVQKVGAAVAWLVGAAFMTLTVAAYALSYADAIFELFA